MIARGALGDPWLFERVNAALAGLPAPTEPPKRVGTNHLKLFMRQGMVERDAIFFNGAERELPNPPWDIAFTIDRNVYRGRASLSISIQEIRSHREM